MRLEKWEGAGNAYLLLEQQACPVPLTAALVERLCDRGLGLGADGILLLAPSAVATRRMTVINPDGSEAEACGNGTRMVGRYLAEADGAPAATIETAAGVLRTTVLVDGRVRASMAPARLDSDDYRPTDAPFPHPHRFVSVGNPHVAIPVDDPAAFPLHAEGPGLEHHAWLPRRANIEVYRPLDRHTVEMRVWERGVGETAACGSGACAVAVAAVLDGSVETPITVRLPGGELEVAVGPDLEIEQTGPAERIAVIDVPDARLEEAA